jgi:acyl-coenzyme A synthetase/AMP-(fatty) acid ligase/thioesterase domain-containing protein
VVLAESGNQNPIARKLLESVRQFPDRPALSDATRSLTFLELSDAIKQFAESFSALQGKKKVASYVPVFVDRNLESAVAILSCLVSDIPFAPLDSEWPEERIARVLDKLGDQKITVVPESKVSVVQRMFGDRLDVVSTRVLMQPDGMHPAKPERLLLEPGYVVFTSGTTGEPKGVEFRGDALWKKLESFVLDERRPVDPISNEVQVHEELTFLGYPFNFGAGIRRLSWVARGSHVYILSKAEMQPQRFLELIASKGAASLNVPASLLTVLSEHASGSFDSSPIQNIQLVSWGGDSVSYSTIHGLKKIFSGNTWFRSGFGATEGSAKLALEFLLKNAPEKGEIPIGKAADVPSSRRLPMEGSKTKFILRFEEPLASGYFNNPELTQSRFKFDETGTRYWMSGDIIEEDQAGNLWHRGRIDDLVKIRGKLSSPSESAKALLDVEGIVDAIVIPKKINGHNRLVAHLVLSKSSPPKLSHIKEVLYQTLPSHLIPTQYFLHGSLPKNSRGKTDRLKLSESNVPLWQERSGFPPMTKTEVTLHTHLKDLLGVEELSIDEILWHTGLDSLAALELETLLRTDFPNAQLDLITQHSTIRSLAKALDRLEGNFSDVVTLNAEAKAAPIYAFPGGGNRSTHFVHFARSLRPSRPVVCLLSGAGDVSIENTTIQGRASRALDSLSGTNVETISIVGYSAGGALAYELSRMCAQNGIKVNLSLFDTGFSIMQKKKKLTVDRYRISKYSSTKKFRGITKVIYLISRAFRKHGFKRAVGLLLFSKPVEFITVYPFLRKSIRIFVSTFSNSIPFGIKSSLSEAIARHELAEYDAKPLTESELSNIKARLFFTETSENYLSWKNLIPSIDFLQTGGNHFTMLHPPHVMELGTKDF